MNIIVKLLKSKGKEKNLESNQEKKKNHRILLQIKKAAEGYHSNYKELNNLQNHVFLRPSES